LTRFFSVQLGFVPIWLGFGSIFSVWLGFIQVWLDFFPVFFNLGSVQFFWFRAYKTKPIGFFKILIGFFFTVRFFQFFFLIFSVFQFFYSPLILILINLAMTNVSLINVYFTPYWIVHYLFWKWQNGYFTLGFCVNNFSALMFFIFSYHTPRWYCS
jgi:hypothetical protein